jgi:biopolymer transport protein ExbB/TolQ
MESFNIIIRFFQEGGPFMYPISLVLALGIAIAIERYIYISASQLKNRRLWGQILPAINKGDLKSAQNIITKSKADIGHILSYGMSARASSVRRDEIETAMEEGLMEIIPRLEKRTHYLATFANIATLLGLLGTIIGLIQAFTAVANADPSEKANLLSASISVAMNTTAYGLMAAIPLILIYTVLTTKTTSLVDSIEMASVKFLNLIAGVAKKAE